MSLPDYLKASSVTNKEISPDAIEKIKKKFTTDQITKTC